MRDAMGVTTSGVPRGMAIGGIRHEMGFIQCGFRCQMACFGVLRGVGGKP